MAFFIHPDYYKMGNLFVSDPILIYRHQKNFPGINDLGLRGKVPLTANKKSKVLIMGDSMVYGHGVNSDETFSSLLNSKNTLVFNGGVKGYGTDQIYLFMRELMKEVDFDVIVFSFNHNDLYDNVIKRRLLIEEDRVIPLKEETFYAKIFLGFYDSVYPWFPSRFLQYLVTKGLSFHGSNLLKSEYDETREKKRVLGLFKLLSKEMKDRGVVFKVLVMPNIMKTKEDFLFLEDSELKESLLSWDDFNQEEFIDSDVHFNKLGHQKMAEKLSVFLQELP